jgi:acetyltransferase-like isoleucine patch superfamily enzyme
MSRRLQRFLQDLLLRRRVSLASRFRVILYRALGMKIESRNRLERIRVRRPSQIELGPSNAFADGCWLWPIDAEYDGIRIRIGASNFFNRDVTIDACNRVTIGNRNMFGPGVFITDSNHTMPKEGWVSDGPMDLGEVSIGNGCWIGAGASILKDVILGDRCIVAAGAVVTRSFPADSTVGGIPARFLKTHS